MISYASPSYDINILSPTLLMQDFLLLTRRQQHCVYHLLMMLTNQFVLFTMNTCRNAAAANVDTIYPADIEKSPSPIIKVDNPSLFNGDNDNIRVANGNNEILSAAVNDASSSATITMKIILYESNADEMTPAVLKKTYDKRYKLNDEFTNSPLPSLPVNFFAYDTMYKLNINTASTADVDETNVISSFVNGKIFSPLLR